MARAGGAILGYDLGDRSFRSSYNANADSNCITKIMDVNPVFKVSALLLATAAFFYSFTPPTPMNVSEKEGAVVPSTYERLMRVMFRGLPVYMVSNHNWNRIDKLLNQVLQVCLWLAAGIESAVILARAYPSFTVSRIILEIFLFEGSGSGIRITAARFLGIILAVLGARLRAWCYRTLGKHFTFVLTMKKDQTLVTTGPYSVIRHPSYTGLAMVVIAIALVHATDGSWMRESGMLRTPFGQLVFVTFILFPVVGIVTLLARVKEEEDELRKRYKKEWEDWVVHVPYMLIPGII